MRIKLTKTWEINEMKFQAEVETETETMPPQPFSNDDGGIETPAQQVKRTVDLLKELTMANS